MAETKQRVRRQVIEEARQASLGGNWEAAIQINKELIERDPKDADAYNRLGRALLEFRDFAGAYEAYSHALKVDPANLISRRNLQRLELLRAGKKKQSKKDTAEHPETVFPRTHVFIEEVGKTWVDELVNPAPMAELAETYAGQQLQLAIEGNRLLVKDANDRKIGEVESKTAERVMELMAGGNIYEVYALGPSLASIRVILREVYRDPSQTGTISFPRQIAASRKYLRERDDLRLRDEADFYLDEETDDEEIAAEPGESDEDESLDAETEEPITGVDAVEEDATPL
jgi:tetratricopeptide (TPR) repeat protein